MAGKRHPDRTGAKGARGPAPDRAGPGRGRAAPAPKAGGCAALPLLPADITPAAFSAQTATVSHGGRSKAQDLLEEALRHDREAMDGFFGDTAEILRARHRAMMQAMWTVWIGFVVIACSGYILVAWLHTLGIEFSLEKVILLWLPVAIIAGTGPVWLPLAVWSERRDLRARLALVAGEEAP